MSDELRFDGRVVIVTGAGGGLGRSHALLFAQRGAHVVVNDLGTARDGTGRSSAAARAVVDEIKARGGSAIDNGDSVEDGDRIVAAALDAFGRVDVVVNNAGILRDASFGKMTDVDWDLVYRVHVRGAFNVTKAAWEPMRQQGYGRVIFTSSAAGLYGNFGQANYAMAKAALTGLGRTLAVEGARKNVLVNMIAPVAGSRMTETVLPAEVVAALLPEHVSPLVVWLCHDSCRENGGVFEVGGGFFAKLRHERSRGLVVDAATPASPERVRDRFADVVDFTDATHPEDIADAATPVLHNLARSSPG
jgi:3-hydroxyacyl-CoA dehydrogenase/3a,7a,12a-trihydroxy-5b-cholest-24-enoyl-CoA hydratase